MAPALPARAQPFSVACPEGHRLTGVRTEGYQALRCPTCGEGIFVLPRSPLPEPAAPARSAPTGRPAPSPYQAVEDGPVALSDPVMRSADAAEPEPEDEIEWVDAPAEAAEAVAGMSPEDLAQEEIAASRTAPGPGRVARGAGSSRRAERGSPAEGRPRVEPAPPGPSLGDRLRRHRNALVFLGVALLVVGTVAFRLRRSRLADLPRVAELGRIEGLAALDEGRFDRAHQILSEAKRAVETLGDAYQGASAIRQGADEAAVIVKLIANPLEDLLDEAARSEAKEWAKTFERLYQGRSVIIDAHVAAVPDGQGEGRYELDYRIFREGEGERPRSVGVIDTTGFRHLELTRPKLGDHITFGARLGWFRYDLDREVWLVGFEPESGVSITHAKALEALGWPPERDAGGEETPP